MRVFIDITRYKDIEFMSGIQRVVSELGKRFLASSDFETLFVSHDRGFSHYQIAVPSIVGGDLKVYVPKDTKRAEDARNAQDTRDPQVAEGIQAAGDTRNAKDTGDAHTADDAAASISIHDMRPGDILFDVDAVWQSYPRRAILYPRLKEKGVKIVPFIHDILPITDPQFFGVEGDWGFLGYLGACINYADCICVTTYATKTVVSDMIHRIGAEDVPIFVTKLGSNLKSEGKPGQTLTGQTAPGQTAPGQSASGRTAPRQAAAGKSAADEMIQSRKESGISYYSADAQGMVTEWSKDNLHVQVSVSYEPVAKPASVDAATPDATVENAAAADAAAPIAAVENATVADAVTRNAAVVNNVVGNAVIEDTAVVNTDAANIAASNSAAGTGENILGRNRNRGKYEAVSSGTGKRQGKPADRIDPGTLQFTSRHPHYVLMVGTIEPRKNHKVILDAFENELFQEEIPLIFAGRIGWKNEELLDRITRDTIIHKNFAFLKGKNTATINYLYQNAGLVVFPSFNEGYGLPIIEALNYGIPVIAGDVPVLREVGGDSCLYCDVNDYHPWAAAIRKLYQDPEAYEAQREKAIHFVPPTWDEVADRIIGKFQELNKASE